MCECENVWMVGQCLGSGLSLVLDLIGIVDRSSEESAQVFLQPLSK